MVRAFVHRHFADICILVGAIAINTALIYGAGFDLGWWSLLFWAGLGCLYAGIKDDIRA